MNTTKPQQKEENPQNEQQNNEEALNKPLWKRIFKVNDFKDTDLNIKEPENTASETQMEYISNTPAIVQSM